MKKKKIVCFFIKREKNCFYFSMKTYIVGAHWKFLDETLSMKTHKVIFYREVRLKKLYTAEMWTFLALEIIVFKQKKKMIFLYKKEKYYFPWKHTMWLLIGNFSLGRFQWA